MPDLSNLQTLIDTGAAWRLEGAVGRAAMDALRSGQCVLPEVRHKDFYGSVVPSRHDVVDAVGSPGSVKNHEAWLAEHEPEPCSRCGSEPGSEDATCALCGHLADQTRCNDCREPLDPLVDSPYCSGCRDDDPDDDEE